MQSRASVLLIIIYTVVACILDPAFFGSEAQSAAQKNKRSIESYVVPDAVLTNQNGMKVNLKNVLQTNKPVLLDFIYSSCTTTCPVLSAMFANVQNRLAPETQKVQLVSVSVDPEHDTPQVMKAYLKQYHAKPGWDYLTGSPAEIAKVIKAFRLKEMSYNYYTLIRTSPDSNWIKITGAMNASELVAEYLK